MLYLHANTFKSYNWMGAMRGVDELTQRDAKCE